MSRKWESNVFGLRRPIWHSNILQLARIGQKKIFHELDGLHVYKVAIKRFWAQEAEMSLKAISLFESARLKFLMNATQNMRKK